MKTGLKKVMEFKKIIALIILALIYHTIYYFCGFQYTVINIGVTIIWLLIIKEEKE